MVTGLCFYIPSAFLAVVLPVWAVILVARKRRRAAALAVYLALPPLAFVLLVENRLFSEPPTVASGYLRLVHWNVGGIEPPGGNGCAARPACARAVRSLRSAQRALGRGISVRSLGPEYQPLVFGNLAVVGAGNVQRTAGCSERSGESPVGHVGERGDRAALLVVDLPSRIDFARDPLLQEVNGLIERDRPDLVVGDFNAPRRSRGLCELPPDYRHAYNVVGSGFGYTWPVPRPIVCP